MRRSSGGRLRRGVLWYASVSVLALAFLLPLWWIVVQSLRPVGQPPPLGVEWWPAEPAWENYRRLSELVPIVRQAGNSLLVGLCAVPLTLLTASWAGYAMAAARPVWRRRLVLWSILMLLIPATALWLTRFLIIRKLGLMDSAAALVAPALAGTSPLYALLFCWTFLRIPREMFEAARLEGAGHFGVWARIAMPLARPTTVTVSILAFAFYWSDLLSPLLYLKRETTYTLPVGLSALQQMDITDGPILMAGAVVAIVPVLLLFLLAHRFFWPDEMFLRPLGFRGAGSQGTHAPQSDGVSTR